MAHATSETRHVHVPVAAGLSHAQVTLTRPLACAARCVKAPRLVSRSVALQPVPVRMISIDQIYSKHSWVRTAIDYGQINAPLCAYLFIESSTCESP